MNELVAFTEACQPLNDVTEMRSKHYRVTIDSMLAD